MAPSLRTDVDQVVGRAQSTDALRAVIVCGHAALTQQSTAMLEAAANLNHYLTPDDAGNAVS